MNYVQNAVSAAIKDIGSEARMNIHAALAEKVTAALEANKREVAKKIFEAEIIAGISSDVTPEGKVTIATTHSGKKYRINPNVNAGDLKAGSPLNTSLHSLVR